MENIHTDRQDQLDTQTGSRLEPDVRCLGTVHTHALTDTSRLLTDTAGRAVASPKNSPKNKQSY